MSRPIAPQIGGEPGEPHRFVLEEMWKAMQWANGDGIAYVVWSWRKAVVWLERAERWATRWGKSHPTTVAHCLWR